MKLFYGSIEPNVEIHPDEQQHISRVLRMKEGEVISLTDGKGRRVEGRLFYEGKKVNLEVESFFDLEPNPVHSLHVAIAPTKNIDRTEYFVEKATELGISEISFILTEHSERKNINIERMEKLAIAASKQSLRLHFPKLNPLMKFNEFVNRLSFSNTFVAHCDPLLERRDISELQINGERTFLIGPEGDFSTFEIKLLQEKGITAVSLGYQRLRTETAAVFVSAWNYFQSI